MAKYRLEEIAPICQGAVPTSNQYWLLNLDAVESNTGRVLEYVYVDYSQIGASTIAFDESNVLYSKLRPYLNKVVLPERPGYATSEMLPLKPDSEVITREYLAYFLRSPDFVEFINGKTSGAKMPRANISDLKAVEIDCPSIKEQKEVVSTFSKLECVVRKRQQQLSELDDLIKARFVEMFGDPISNEKGWLTAPLTGACSKIYGGGTPSKNHPEYFEGTIPWVSPKDMKSDVIFDSIDHITEDAIKNSTTNLVPEGSVLMVIRSGILKHNLPVAINAVPVTINQDMKAFIPGRSIKASFLRYYFKAIEPDVLAGVRGVTADNIDFKSFQQREIIIPPIDLQIEFEEFCKQVDKSRYAIQKSLNETQLLFDSLMQKIFG